MAWLYVEGAGVERSEESASRWFERAAQSGNPDAVRELARRRGTPSVDDASPTETERPQALERPAPSRVPEPSAPVSEPSDRDALP